MNMTESMTLLGTIAKLKSRGITICWSSTMSGW